ncbi:ArsR family transcriptional regulator [Kribbella italica]|uniref:Protein-tyrosine-phosphatase/DNA-binding HxlR family transcriptional regulator n=1 Tax=Kribbella italica TaxID=1540520 RepID=A0A7W9JE97_9ACTN|nr:helix-turn-helix domain-containing protein [Kribbella italica]MBB5840551.1 protein-tyrosine-phosphatase/DNA-binding HxlR family transcriptional regulator [Kribbella italica]
MTATDSSVTIEAMNIEEKSRIKRARVHAALGDPARLAVVDTLMVGDAAPSELGALLEMPTNLVAHHLKVLEEADLVVRTRSEGDHRRTYVRLVPETLAIVTSPSLTEVPRVVFVCTHNSARSQLAAAIWARRSHVPVASAGTRPAERVHPRALKVARRHGLDTDAWRTAQVDDVVSSDDLVIAVCDIAYEDLPVEARPRVHWSVPDPAPTDTDAAFEAAYSELAGRIDRLAPLVSSTEAKRPRSKS